MQRQSLPVRCQSRCSVQTWEQIAQPLVPNRSLVSQKLVASSKRSSWSFYHPSFSSSRLNPMHIERWVFSDMIFHSRCVLQTAPPRGASGEETYWPKQQQSTTTKKQLPSPAEKPKGGQKNRSSSHSRKKKTFQWGNKQRDGILMSAIFFFKQETRLSIQC